MSESVNPLLTIQFPVPFDQITASLVEPAINELLNEARTAVDQVASAEGPHTFENTLLELEATTERLEYAITVVRHLESVATTPELRAVNNAVEPIVSEFFSSIPLHEGLWNRLRVYAQTPEAHALKGPRKRMLKKSLEDFRRHGAELDEAGKRRLAEIDVELTKLTTKFGENVLDATNAYELMITDESRLSGLPSSAIAAAGQSAQSKSREGWRFTLQAPSYLALMTYLDDASIRREVYESNNVRTLRERFDNQPVLGKILNLRREKAILLGYPDFADLVLEDRMAHRGEKAEEFLVSLQRKTEAQFRRENDDLLAYRKSIEGPAAPALQPWDVAYYAEKQRAALYDFNEEELRPYFPLQSVVDGMFSIVGLLYGITVTEMPGIPGWSADVRFHEIRDSDGRVLGAFYTDWYPRENKRGGAWMDALLTGSKTSRHGYPHLGLMCGNLTPPIGDQPALLTHRDVETIFHEFGHLLHHCLSEAELRSQAGTSVAWDFVELPSQIMENWCWEREALDLFARHYQTGAPIPEELFQKMRRAKTFRSANGQMRQLGFGLVDLSLHRRYDPHLDGDLMAYTRRILQQFSSAPLPAEYGMVFSFTHLFGSPVGYAAGYYSYKWAEVLDADAFTQFRESGIFSREVGIRFRSEILARGDSEDPAELYRAFMGREPQVEALLERLGLALA